MRGWLVVVALALAATVNAATTPEIRYESGKLWVHAARTRAGDLFESIRKRTGVAVELDPALTATELTIDLDGIDLERGIRSMVAAIPGAAGHSLSYARGRDRRTRLTGVKVFAPGVSRAPVPTSMPVLSSSPPFAAASPIATVDPEERMQRMMEAGVPRETAERVMELTREVQGLQATPAPGSLSPEDLGAESRAQLPALMERGVSMERAVQMLLIQERYRQALEELRRSQAGETFREFMPAPSP